VLQMEPQNALGYVKMAELRMVQKRTNDAEALYKQALTHDPHSQEALEGLVGIAFSRNKPADALKLVQDRVRETPDNVPLLILLAHVQVDSRQFEDAERTLNHAADLDKQNVVPVALLGSVQSLRGETDTALATMQRAVAMAPNDPGLAEAIAELYGRQGNWQQAESSYQKVLSMQPENPLASNNLAYLMLEHGGSVNVALTLAQAGHKGMPNVPSSADTLGWAYYQNGAYSVAAPLFEDAIKKMPTNLTYHYHLGLTYQKLKDSTKARAELQKVISLDPKSPVAEQARQALQQTPGNS